jgi:hypothetical protein
MYPNYHKSKILLPIITLLLIILILVLDRYTYSTVPTAVAYPSFAVILFDICIDLLMAGALLMLFWYLVREKTRILAVLIIIAGIILVILRMVPTNIVLIDAIIIPSCRLATTGYFLIATGTLGFLLPEIDHKKLPW